MVSIWEALQYCPQPSAPREAGTAAQGTHLELTLEQVAKAASSCNPCKAAHLAIEADHQPLLALLALDDINGGIHVLQQGGYSGAICICAGPHARGPARAGSHKDLLRPGALAAYLVLAALANRAAWLTMADMMPSPHSSFMMACRGSLSHASKGLLHKTARHHHVLSKHLPAEHPSTALQTIV